MGAFPSRRYAPRPQVTTLTSAWPIAVPVESRYFNPNWIHMSVVVVVLSRAVVVSSFAVCQAASRLVVTQLLGSSVLVVA